MKSSKRLPRPVRPWLRTAALSASLLASASLPVQGATLLRGDADGNGFRQITDAILVLNFLFTGGKAPICSPAADSNADGAVNISDPVSLLGHLFLGAPTPPDLTEEQQKVCSGIDPEAIARGMKEFVEADPEGNLFSCALCHSMQPESDKEIIRPGHTLLDSLGRPSFKSGGRATYVGAVNVCRDDWMAIVTEIAPGNAKFIPWTEEEPRYKDLVAFIKSLSTSDTSPALSFEIVPPAKSGPTTGDPVAGCELFNRSCSICHQKGGVGQAGVPDGQFSPGPSLVDVLDLCPNQSDPCLNAFCEPAPAACLDNPDYIRYRIRLSGPDKPDLVYHVPAGFKLSGTVMPFWAKDKLTDAEVEDLTAFIAAARQAVRDGKPTFDCTEAPNPDGKALRRGTLNGRFHGVAGVVEELDTRKIRINDFSYDGGGIQVKVWLYKNGSIRGGKAIGPDIFGQPMRNTTFVVDIPESIPSDSFDSVSIWCVAAKEDFGNAQLETVP